jgi:PPOX class probable F420-dependent enzyme
VAVIDASTRSGQRAAERLRDELIIWLTTVRADGQPQASPVWFLWDGDEFLVYSVAVTPRIRNIEANRRVALNLDGNGRGGDIVSFEGEAYVDRNMPPASANPIYLAKYQGMIDGYGWTAESFSADYPLPIRIRPTRVRL